MDGSHSTLRRMSSSGSSSNTPVVVIHRSKIARADEGRHVVCTEFKQVRYPFKWRKYICARCGETLSVLIKRLILRYKWDQEALAASIAATREKCKEEGSWRKGRPAGSPAS